MSGLLGSRLSTLSRAVVLATLVALIGLVPMSAANAAATITISRGSVIGGESITVGGTIGQKKVRKVVLQRQSGSTWVTVIRSQTTSKGAYKFGYKPPTKAGSRTVVRVLAPKTKIKGKKYAKIVSGGRTVLTVAQKATITAPSVVSQDATFTISGKFGPARIGRPVVVQKPSGSSWVSVTQPRYQTSAGLVNFPMVLKVPGNYTFRVATLAADGAPAAYSAAVEVTVTLPVPTGLTATPGDTSVALSWAAVTTPGLTGYNVYSSTDPNASPAAWTKLTANPVSATSYNATSLSNGVTYYFAVTSVKTGDESAFSVKASAKPVQAADTTPPPVPTGVTAEAGTASAQISWSAVAAADLKGYHVYRATNAAGPWTRLTASTITATTYGDSGLTNGTEYFFAVTSVDNTGNESAKSTPDSATPTQGADTTPPPVPTGVQATAGSGTAQVSWSAVSAVDLAGYKVYRGTSAGDPNPTLLTANPVTELTLPVNGLTNGTTYYFFVTSVDTSGNESTRSTSASATPAAPPAGWASVSTGLQHTCATGSNGTLFCWGLNRHGQLGNATGVETGNAYTTPARVGSSTDWTSVSAGNDFTCGIQAPGTLWCWGRNTYGQLGIAPGAGAAAEDPHPTPLQIGTATNWTSVSAGGESVCGVAGGSVLCWGLNLDGQLGRAANVNTTAPNPTQVAVDGVTTYSSVSVGTDQACATRTDATLYCWGANLYGQLGNAGATMGTFTPTTSPTAVTGTTWTSVSAGDQHTCATKTGNTLFCWGSNTYGELGKAANEDPNGTASQVAGTTWKQVSVGGDHTCATTTDNTVFCWGRNQNGQLGKAATTTPNPTPAKVGSGTTWSSVDAGAQSTCARNAANQIFCWGLNEFGQLGNTGVVGENPPTAGTTNPNPTPLVVPVPS